MKVQVLWNTGISIYLHFINLKKHVVNKNIFFYDLIRLNKHNIGAISGKYKWTALAQTDAAVDFTRET